jgi:MYXO-CTERM domain-containing protein
VDIIASGPHNSTKIRLNVLNGLQPEPSRAIVASFRGVDDAKPSVWPTVAIAALVLGALLVRRRG